MALKILNRNRGKDQAEMSFIDHLEALRWHIVRSLIAIIIGAVFIFIKIDWVFDHVILGPIQTRERLLRYSCSNRDNRRNGRATSSLTETPLSRCRRR